MNMYIRKIKDFFHKLNKKDLIIYYLTGICLLCASFYLINVFVDGKYFSSVLHRVSNDTFMDHFNSLYNTKFDPYKEQFSNYPAMACFIYRVFAAMIPAELRNGNAFDLKNVHIAMTTFLVFISITLWIIQIIILEKSLLEKRCKILLSFIILLCAPIVFTLERGNLILLSFMLTMFFSFYYESKNKLLKELSFVALAFAAAIKIYPAIFGLLLLKKKNLKEIVRLILYGVLAFILPFFYYDGIESMLIMINALKTTSNITSEVGYGVNISLYNIIKTFTLIFNIQINDMIIYLFYIAFIIMLLSFFFTLKKKWQEFLCVTLLLIFIPKTNYYYAMIFMIIPFIEFLNECKSQKKPLEFNEYIALIYFAILLIPWATNFIPIFEADRFPVSYGMLVYYFVLCWFVILLFAEWIKERFNKHHQIFNTLLFGGTSLISALTILMAMIHTN